MAAVPEVAVVTDRQNIFDNLSDPVRQLKDDAEVFYIRFGTYSISPNHHHS